MALSTVLRLTSSSLARFQPLSSFPLFSPRRRWPGSSDLRFLSTAHTHRTTSLKARRKDKEEDTKEGKAGEEEGIKTLSVKDGDKVVLRDEKMVATELHKEAKESYMAYAMSVLIGRALPDVRDGLKPVHRRIL
ncbi:hypothetical protein KSP40_PGU007387 [Platanthera guangdongensis]|uniref:Topo IIA-type catalytic domain-containing protein n=1 Tax=Platanthera guangdongensis TaxID=2320717 RepID=A0ABR2MY82_9ASPA